MQLFPWTGPFELITIFHECLVHG